MMSYARKVSRVYQFGLTDLFADRTAQRKSNAIQDKTLAKLEVATVLPIRDDERLMIEYVKSSVKAGDVLALPTPLFQTAVSTEPSPPSPVVDDEVHLKLLKQVPLGAEVNDIWLEIIDPRPESKTQVKIIGKANSPHLLFVYGTS